MWYKILTVLKFWAHSVNITCATYKLLATFASVSVIYWISCCITRFQWNTATSYDKTHYWNAKHTNTSFDLIDLLSELGISVTFKWYTSSGIHSSFRFIHVFNRNSHELSSLQNVNCTWARPESPWVQFDLAGALSFLLSLSLTALIVELETRRDESNSCWGICFPAWRIMHNYEAAQRRLRMWMRQKRICLLQYE